MAVASRPKQRLSLSVAGLLCLASLHALADPAAGGGPASQYQQGLRYDLGQGVPADPSTAYRFYLGAARQGLPEAEFNVAVMNDSGRGTSHNPAAAAEWYARAAAHGHQRAQYNLAQLYESGEGVPRNLQAASAWYEAVAGQLPAAAGRLAALRAQGFYPSAANRVAALTLARPEPAMAASGNASGPVPIELVWTAPAQPVRVRYFVTLLALDGGTPTPVFSAFAERSAVLGPPLAPGHPYAWRVYAVAQDTAHYAAGAWRLIRQ